MYIFKHTLFIEIHIFFELINFCKSTNICLTVSVTTVFSESRNIFLVYIQIIILFSYKKILYFISNNIKECIKI